MGLVKTRRLAAMQKQQRAIHLRQGFRLRQDYVGQAGGLKAGLKSRQLKVTPPPRSLHRPPPHFAKSGGNFRADVVSYPA